MTDKRCKTCEYFEHEPIDNGFVCVNDASEHAADFVEESDSCHDWQEKKTEKERRS